MSDGPPNIRAVSTGIAVGDIKVFREIDAVSVRACGTRSAVGSATLSVRRRRREWPTGSTAETGRSKQTDPYLSDAGRAARRNQEDT